jgi:small subunit ribosomal protein S8
MQTQQNTTRWIYRIQHEKAIAQILVDEGYVKSFQVIEDGKQGIIRITFKYSVRNSPR